MAVDNCWHNTQPTTKATLTDNNFLDLFFNNKQEVINTFTWIIEKNRSSFRSDPDLSVVRADVSYSCRASKTISLHSGYRWRYILDFVAEEYLNVRSWIRFLTVVSKQTSSDRAKKLSVNGGTPGSAKTQFFWNKFLLAYLHFASLSKMSPQNNLTFLTFLDNLKVGHITRVARLLDTFQKQWGWLGALPGVSLSSFGKEGFNLLPLFNQDPNTLNLDTFSSEYLKYFDLVIASFRSSTDLSRAPIATMYLTLINKVLDVVKQPGFWTQLQVILSNPWGIKSLFFNNQEYSLENLINTLSLEGYNPDWKVNFDDLTNAAVAELVKIIFGNSSDAAQGVDSPTKLQDRFEETKTKLLTDLKTALEQIVSLNSTITQLTIKGKTYHLDQLIALRNNLLDNDFQTKHQQAFAQVRILMNDKITGDQIKTTFDQLNNQKLDTLWTGILDLFNKRGGSFAGNQITIKDKSYPFKEIAYAASVILPNNPSGSSLTTDVKQQLQTLVNNGVTAKDIETYIDSLAKAAEAAKEEQSTKNKNLAIGLGTLAGSVGVGGVGGFAYWFTKLRK